jgi:DNA-binding IclR family transcriptional regulator
MNVQQKVSNAEPKHQPLKEKWGDALRQGFVVIPWVMLRRQRELDLETLELVVLMHLIASWWDTASAPYPSSQAVAKRMGVSVRTVQRCLKTLQTKGLLIRHQQSVANDGASIVTRYDLTPLAAKLSDMVKDQIKLAQEAKREESAYTTLN